jgi:hypothetical protein
LHIKATLNIQILSTEHKLFPFFPIVIGHSLHIHYIRSHSNLCRVRVSNAPGGAARRRVSRGQFIAEGGSVVNAAYNMLRKAFPNALAEGIEDASLHPVRMPFGTACECT